MEKKALLTLILCGLAAVVIYAAGKTTSGFGPICQTNYVSVNANSEHIDRLCTEMVLSQFIACH
ncbi:MAG TPA: hypothetical protein PK052_10785 [Anaerohalosphaeraceae bacterium]|nr:hypothetical protein [Phycisphaerae bacterium]HOK95503.1 hypothetical protein [Anaerohalosphaeraceae bacterium]HOL32456.1 hypothetical protein [Anaerohalosphaeraceae bacterium]HOM75844.1 hypothetical protein [Anaerohalosphaeraceae bacterium]HPC64852.1 hypothetical protein [Anaerohalosphaeraceae bacterium]